MYQNLNSLPPHEKTKLFIVYDKNFFNGGVFALEKEAAEYKKLGLPPPLLSLRGGYMPSKGYTLDPVADSMSEMLGRMVIW